MNQRVVVDPFNAGSKEVDAALGNAYPVVRKVYDNLQDILYVAANLEKLTPHDVEIQANDDLKQIEWRYVGGTTWTKLITYVELLGADIPELIAELNALQAQMNQTAAEIEAAVPIVTTARDQALQAVIDAANASRLTLGTVITDADHTEVSIEGPAGAQVINFTLQKGDKGTPNTLTIGTVIEGSVPAATITGESPNQQLNLVLPRGEDGYTPNFTVGDVVTGSPGTEVEVTISGTAPNFVLDFKIPQGQSGAGSGDMLNSDNLGGLTDFALARSNIGLGNVNNTSDTDKPVSSAQQTALDLKVDKEAGKVLSSNDYTTAEKNKLAALNQYFKGTYVSLSALQTAVPSGNAGDYAIVDGGVGQDATQYNWDVSDSKWVSGGGVITSTDVVPEGTSNLYHTSARVLSTILAGLNTALTGDVTNTDTVLQAFGRLQNKWNNFAASVCAVVLTGLSTADASVVVATDSILSAIGKLQKQITDLTSGVKGPAFKAYASGAQALPSTTAIKIPFNTAVYDTHSGFDATNRRYVAPVAGYYSLTASVGVGLGSDTGAVILDFYKNGSVLSSHARATLSGDAYMVNATTVLLSAGDYIEIWMTQATANSHNTYGGSSLTDFTVTMVRPA